MRAIRGIRLALAVMLAAVAAQAGALDQGRTDDGIAYVSGGIGFGEREELAQARADYSLRVLTAARGSGAYLAGVRVNIVDIGGRRLFDRPLDGPVLLVDLPAGRYRVEATRDRERKTVQTTIRSGEKREIFFYFDEPNAEVRPREDPPR